jgi:hypothetical protein
LLAAVSRIGLNEFIDKKIVGKVYTGMDNLGHSDEYSCLILGFNGLPKCIYHKYAFTTPRHTSSPRKTGEAVMHAACGMPVMS